MIYLPGSYAFKLRSRVVILVAPFVIRSYTILAFVLRLPIIAETRDSSAILQTLRHANDLLRAGDYKKAQPLFQTTLHAALSSDDRYYAARAHVGLTVCFIVSHDLKSAVAHAENALKYGLAAKDADIAVRAALNLSNIYRRMGNYNSALQALRDVNPFLPQITDVALNAQIYIHLGNEAARQNDWPRAEPLFLAAIDAALRNNDPQSAATFWNQLGRMRLRSNHLAEAEAALTEGFRLRRFGGNRNLGTSYTYLGMLRMAQKDPRSALNLLNRAVEVGWNGEASARLANVYYWRAKAKVALYDVPGALADFHEAITHATQWREDLLAADDDRISFEVSLHRMYEDYIATGMNEWWRSRNAALLRRMFEVAEQHKLASFGQTLTARKTLPPEYWSALGEYRAALASAWRSGQSEPTTEWRMKLSRIESSLGMWNKAEGHSRVADVQRFLGSDEALMSFVMGESQSWMWAITRSSIEAFRLPGRGQITTLATRFRASLEDGTPVSGANEQLYVMLFESLSPKIRRKKDWLLSLDQGLFELPFAALGSAGSPLILSHSLRTIFGADWSGDARVPVTSTRFVGAGDAIYNSADARWRGPHPPKTTEFARLVGTGAEVRATSRAWTLDRRPTLLTGTSFTRETLDHALRSSAGVVHIAAHFVRNQSDASEIMIGLGLANDGMPDFLTSSDVAVTSVRVGLVSLNGCSSGGGAELPGAGLVGMTRSWLVAGATAVAATYWPVPDDRGELFQRMYGFIAAGGKPGITARTAARALQSAQLAAWRSSKRHDAKGWAGVFLSTKS